MRWALVGASAIASSYMIPALRAQQDGKIISVCSGSRDRAESFAKDNAIPQVFDNLDELLADDRLDAAYISSTNEKHHSQAMAVIAAGKHVLCEKPLAMSREDAAAMVLAAEAAGVTFATNHHLRCSGSHRKIRQLITDGRVGKVLSVRIFHAVHLPPHLQGWRINDPGAGGGVIPDITVHDADVARFLLGEDPVDVVAQMATSGMGDGVEDSAMSVWTMPSGAMVMSHESFTHPYAGSGLQVHGTEGSIFAKGVMTQEPVGEITLVTAAGSEAVPFPDHNLYIQGVADFYAAVAGTGRAAADGLDGVKSLTIAHAVREAARTGMRVTIDYGRYA